MSRDLSIIFSAPMVRALLDGRKTQTRRLASSPLAKCKPGDRLYVRENFAVVPVTAYRMSEGVVQTTNPTDADEAAIYACGWERSKPRWRPSIHMPRWASRITLTVSEVRTQPLRAISYEDAIEEGCTMRPHCSGFQDREIGWSMDWSEVGRFSKFATGGPGPLKERDISIGDPKHAFASFINRLHNGDGWNLPGRPKPIWDENPEVVALTFTVHKTNIDQMP